MPNRDELGTLARDLNGTTARLSKLFDDERALAEELSVTNASLARASEAKALTKDKQNAESPVRPLQPVAFRPNLCSNRYLQMVAEIAICKRLRD